MRILVWQWGRRGAGPRLAALLAEGVAALPQTDARLALSAGAEILRSAKPPRCDLLLPVYRSVPGLLRILAQWPVLVRRIRADIVRLRPALAVCAMPAPLDLLMLAALHRAHIPVAVIVHDADPHPGDIFPIQHRLMRALIRRMDAIIVLSAHVGERLHAQGLLRGDTILVRASLPPLDFQRRAASQHQEDGRIRVLNFGRLLAYKGLDLLADALTLLGPRPELEMRVVGQGPDSPALQTLRSLPGVNVENRWVPEDEIGDLIAWADLIVLPYREASQSGVAAAALAQGKRVLATRVGGLVEQLEREDLATLCEPDAASIAAALDEFARAPLIPAGRLPNAKEAWRDFAGNLLERLGPALYGNAGRRGSS